MRFLQAEVVQVFKVQVVVAVVSLGGGHLHKALALLALVEFLFPLLAGIHAMGTLSLVVEDTVLQRDS
jgi:hypothetical protein